MESQTQLAAAAKAWPFEQARALVERLKRAPKAGPVIFETGYGPSGLPHIGTIQEVARTTHSREGVETAIQEVVQMAVAPGLGRPFHHAKHRRQHRNSREAVERAADVVDQFDLTLAPGG